MKRNLVATTPHLGGVRDCGLVLTVLVALIGLASPSKATRVDVGYSIAASFGIPGLGVPAVGPPALGVAVISYTNATLSPAARSALGGFGAFTPLHARAIVNSAAFSGPLSFTIGGDLFTGMAGGAFAMGPGALFTGPAFNVLLSGGTLKLGFIGGVSGLVHCTGMTCTGLGFPASSILPIGFALNGLISGLAGPGSILLPSFTLSGLAGTFGGLTVTGSITFIEAPLFGPGLSRHLVPEPGIAALLALGLLGLVGARGVLRR